MVNKFAQLRLMTNTCSNLLFAFPSKSKSSENNYYSNPKSITYHGIKWLCTMSVAVTTLQIWFRLFFPLSKNSMGGPN
jgi:hypothetical protein